MNNKPNGESVELTDQELESVMGGFSVGETLYLKSGETRCTVCGARIHCIGTYEGMAAVRLVAVTLPCGHQTYIPQTAITTEP